MYSSKLPKFKVSSELTASVHFRHRTWRVEGKVYDPKATLAAAGGEQQSRLNVDSILFS